MIFEAYLGINISEKENALCEIHLEMSLHSAGARTRIEMLKPQTKQWMG